MTPKQRASTRNWQKARLLSFHFREDVMNGMEREWFAEIEGLKTRILTHWDYNTASFLGHPLKPHKCEMCGKRSNRSYTHLEISTNSTKEVNLCKSCNDIYNEN